MRQYGRSILIGLILLIVGSVIFAGGSTEADTTKAATGSEKLPDISILINESPWLEAFRTIVKVYESETGNKVEIVGSPYSALLTRITNSLTAPESEFDIVILDEVWSNQFYEGGLVAALSDIEPGFTFDKGVLEYNWATRWDHELGTNAETGKIYGVPINGNMQILYYRTDLLKEAGFEPPKTWDEVFEIAEYFFDPPKMYGMVGRASGRPDFGLQAVLHSLDGYLLDYDVTDGSWDIGINRPEAHEALRIYLRLVQDYSPQDYTSIGQAQMISLMQSGRVPMIYTVAAAAPSFDNPAASTVVGKVGATIVPGPAPGKHAPTTGIQPFAIPNNLPNAQKQAALAFLKWVISPEVQVKFGQAGGIVTRQDAWETLAKDPKFWWANAIAESTPYAHGQIRVVPGGRIFSALETLLKAVVAGDLTNERTLQLAEEEIRKIMLSENYKVN
jgi:multiple sugar transport system substrate-binding protein